MSLRRPPHDQRPIADADALADRWRAVLESEPFRTRCLWLLFLDPVRRPTGPVLLVEDLPDGPYDLRVDDLVGICREILDGPGGAAGPGVTGSVALMLSRPGGAPWTVSDRAWARFLTRASGAIGPPQWPVRLAHRYGAADSAEVLGPTACARPPAVRRLSREQPPPAGSPRPGRAGAPAPTRSGSARRQR